MNVVKPIQTNIIFSNPYQPRTTERDPEKFVGLAISILRDGLLQHPAGRFLTDDKFELAFGEGRVNAYRLIHKIMTILEKNQTPLPGGCGIQADADFKESYLWVELVTRCQNQIKRIADFETIPAFVQEYTDQQLFEYAASENLQREDLGAIDVARAMQTYIDQFGSTVAETASLFGKSESTIRNMVRLTKLPENVQERLNSGSLSINQGIKLLSVQRVSPGAMVEAAKEISSDDSIAEVNRIIGDKLASDKNTLKIHNSYDGDIPRAGAGLWQLDKYQTVGKYRPVDVKKLFKQFPDYAVKLEHAFPDQGAVKGLQEVANWIFQAFSEDAPAEDRTPEAFQKLWDLDYDIYEWLIQNINPGLCSECPFHFAVNKVHYCTNKPCHVWKTEQYTVDAIQTYSAEHGFPIYDEAKDGEGLFINRQNFPEWGRQDDGTFGRLETPWQEWITKKNKDLRLYPTPDLSGRGYSPSHNGTDEKLFGFCIVGKTLQKYAKTQAEKQAKSDAARAEQDAQEQETRDKNYENRELLKHLTQAFIWTNIDRFAKVFEPFHPFMQFLSDAQLLDAQSMFDNPPAELIEDVDEGFWFKMAVYNSIKYYIRFNEDFTYSEINADVLQKYFNYLFGELMNIVFPKYDDFDQLVSDFIEANLELAAVDNGETVAG